MATISLCMIVKNEEQTLARCLESVAGIPDEIIIVDTGSTDKTKEIARRYTPLLYDFEWVDDFSAARNFSFSKAEMDYCLWLDADDILLPEDHRAFLALKEALLPQTDLVMMKYHIAFDQSGAPTFSYFRERLIRRLSDLRWSGEIHEAIVPKGNIQYVDIGITHRKIKEGDPDRNLRIFEKLLKAGKQLEPRQQFYYARELYYHKRWQEAIDIFTAFLEEGRGWVENNIEACRMIGACYLAMGEERAALQGLLRSLEYDCPRAEICCDIGAHFIRVQGWKRAIYWYRQALSAIRDDRSGGFVLPDCYGYIPALQLCLCYDRLGEMQTAYEYNELAGQFKPESEAYLFNKQYYADRIPPA